MDKHILDSVLATKQGEAAYKVVSALTDAGFDTWWVGGCVRDMLQGKTPHDIDIATAALPEQVVSALSKAKKEDAFLGAARVEMGSAIFEVTTFREDDEASDGRHPEAVVFGTREKDARRRDFTVNAIYCHPISRGIFDPFEGEEDLHEKLVRFIGEPALRIKHDALRILRAVRLRAALEGQYEPETYKALHELNQLVETLSGTRQLEELEKMLKLQHPQRSLEDLWELGILQYMLPELAACKGIAQPADYHHEGDVWDHTLQCTASFREEDGPDVRLAALFHDCGKPVTFSRKERICFDEHAAASAKLSGEAFARLQMPKKRSEKIGWLIEHHMMMGSFASMSDERKAHWYHHPWFEDLQRLFRLDVAGTDPADYSLCEEIERDRQKFLDSHPRPEKQLLSGDEVMEILGVRPGEAIGKILAELKKEQVEKHITKKTDAKEFLLKRKASS